MQNRRTVGDDGKGVMEALDERETADDLGIRVNAKYQMQIFDRKKTFSKQREI